MSITSDGRGDAEEFIRQHEMPWPCLYGATRATLEPLHVLLPSDKAVSVAPTLYLVRADGSVVWNDDRARYRHETARDATRELEQAIEAALKAG